MADDSVGLVKTSYDDVNSALEGLIGNISAGNTANYITSDKLNQILSGYATSSQLSNVSQYAASVPVGTVLSFGSNTIPNGYLLCNGASYDTGKYATLYSAIGASSVPDLRGLFLRGLDTAGQYDVEGPNRKIFDFEEGSYLMNRHDGYGSVSFAFAGTSPTNHHAFQKDKVTFRSSSSVTNQTNVVVGVGNSGSDWDKNNYWNDNIGVARPKNSAVNYIIKAQ